MKTQTKESEVETETDCVVVATTKYSVGGLESDLHYYIGAFTAVRTVKAVAPPEDNYAELSDI